MTTVEFGWSAYDPDSPSETRDNGDPARAASLGQSGHPPTGADLHPAAPNALGLPASVRRALARGGCAASRALSRDEAWLRMETTWVHAQTRHGMPDPTVTRWRGRRRAESQVTLRGLTVDESSRLLRHQLTQGSWGAYRKGVSGLGFLRPEGFRPGFSPASAGLTPAGSELANWFLGSFLHAPARDVLKRAARDGQVDASDLEKIPPAGRPPPPKLGRLIEDGVENARVTLDIRALRGAFDADACAFSSVVNFPESHLALAQLEALRSARAVLRLVEEIEFGYRIWMLGDTPPESSALSDDDAWVRAVADSETEVLELRAAGRSGDWQGVHRWQEELARRRGSRPFERNEVPERYAERRAPTFALPSLGGLFAEGLFGEPLPDWWVPGASGGGAV